MEEGEKLEKRIQSVLDKIKNNKEISRENTSEAEKWTDFLRAKGIAPKTIAKHLYCLERFLVYMPRGVTLRKATREDIQHAVGRIESSDYSPETKHVIKVIIKAFYKHTVGEDEFYPRQVSWIKTTLSKNRRRKLPEEMLTEEEVLKLIRHATNPRDKAIIALLYDSGMRVGELIGLKMGSIDLSKEPAHAIVDGKTGMRNIPILFSAPYVANYLDTVPDKKSSDYLLTAQGSWSNMNRRIDEAGIRKVLREAAKRAGIEKRVYPHLFRHSRATYYANRLTEQQLKAFFGWTGSSQMAATYVHLSGRDIDNAIMQAHGKLPKEIAVPKLTEKICPRCRYANGIDFLHCKRCGAPLELGAAVRATEVTDTMKDAMMEIFNDPAFQREMLKRMEERGKKGK